MPYYPMMDWYPLRGFWMNLIWLVVVLVIAYFIYTQFKGGTVLTTNKSAEDILNERYAKGELTREQFMQMKGLSLSLARQVQCFRRFNKCARIVNGWSGARSCLPVSTPALAIKRRGHYFMPLCHSLPFAAHFPMACLPTRSEQFSRRFH